MKFRVGQKVERQIGEYWQPGVVAFVWRGMDLETGKRIACYDVADDTAGPVGYKVLRVPEAELRRSNRARGRRRVLRAHSVKMERFT